MLPYPCMLWEVTTAEQAATAKLDWKTAKAFMRFVS